MPDRLGVDLHLLGERDLGQTQPRLESTAPDPLTEVIRQLFLNRH
jgi:hypothetical protein